MTTTTTKLRGWAALKHNNPERFAELTRKGGASVPKEKRAFSTDRDLAISAGRKGGEANGQRVRSF